jgi:hypothetical protein
MQGLQSFIACALIGTTAAAAHCCCCSDIDYVEFQRQGGGVISSSVRTFDLLIKQRSNNTVRGRGAGQGGGAQSVS